MKLSVITEGYGSVVNFKYDNAQHDTKPRVLLLGRWRNPNTRNILVAGINLNYLDDDQVSELRKVLPEILKPRNLKSRYWRGKSLLPDIFSEYYRTYDQDYLGAVTRDTLKFFKPDELDQPPPEAPGPDQPKTPQTPEGGAPAGAVPAPTPAPVPEPELVAPDEMPTPVQAPVVPEPIQPEEEPSPEEPTTQTIEQPEPQDPAQGSEEADATLEPEMEETPIERRVGELDAELPKKPVAKTPPDKQKGLTSKQRREIKAQSIKKAVDMQKQMMPPVKPEPPDEFKDVLGLFKNKE